MKLRSGLLVLLFLSGFGAHAGETKHFECTTGYCKFDHKVDAFHDKNFRVSCTSSDYPNVSELKCSAYAELAYCGTPFPESGGEMKCDCTNDTIKKEEFHIKIWCSS